MLLEKEEKVKPCRTKFGKPQKVSTFFGKKGKSLEIAKEEDEDDILESISWIGCSRIETDRTWHGKEGGKCTIFSLTTLL